MGTLVFALGWVCFRGRGGAEFSQSLWMLVEARYRFPPPAGRLGRRSESLQDRASGVRGRLLLFSPK